MWACSAAQLKYGLTCRNRLYDVIFGDGINRFSRSGDSAAECSREIREILETRYAGWWIGLYEQYFLKRYKNPLPDVRDALLNHWHDDAEYVGLKRVTLSKTDPRYWNPANNTSDEAIREHAIAVGKCFESEEQDPFAGDEEWADALARMAGWRPAAPPAGRRGGNMKET